MRVDGLYWIEVHAGALLGPLPPGCGNGSRALPPAARSESVAASALLNTAIALPAHCYPQEEVRAAVGAWLAADAEKAARADAILAGAEVAQRYLVRPAEWYLRHTSVRERSEVYRDEMVRLCEQATREALAGAAVHPADVGLIISTSCTGLMIPSVEALLMNRVPFRPETRRQPLTTLGCAAGAAALGQADRHLRAHPDEAVLIVSAELASLTAQVSDFSMANIVSVALFGDGAAATVAVGARFRHRGSGADRAGPHRPARVVATRSVLFPDTEDMMGFDNTDTGLRIFLQPRVPRFLRSELPRHVVPFLAEHGLAPGDVAHWLLHPGGRKVLQGLQEVLGLAPQQTHLSWRVLRDYGNLSSATVLFILHHFEREATPAPGDHGLLAAVGPGFAAELVLLQW